jgi:anti-sigma B factor antagonist
MERRRVIKMSEDPPEVPPPTLLVSQHPASDGGVRLAVAGEVDVCTANRLHEALTTALDARPSTVVVDLAEVTFIDSSAITALMTARRRASAGGGTLTVINGNGIVRRVLEVTGVLHALTEAGDPY